MSIIRKNLMAIKNYTPYCGGMCVAMPRTRFNGDQFCCPKCGWCSTFPKDFINKYKKKKSSR